MNQAHASHISKVAVVAAIVTKDRRLTLLSRQPDRNDPLWKFAGGGVKENETVREALVREIADETGFQIPYDKKTGLLGDKNTTVEELLIRLIKTRLGEHTQHFFLVQCAERDLLYLDHQIRKEDDDTTIETKIFPMESLATLPNFLHWQRPLLKAVQESLRAKQAA